MTVADEVADEYERFGPWIDEVTTPGEVPRLFRSHPLDLSTARLVLKVPRNVARRDVRAGADLYDHLLVVDDRDLTVLSRRPAEPGTFTVRTLALDGLASVRDVVSLLDAHLTVASRDGTSVTVPYNGSAREHVTRLVDELRGAVAGAQPTPLALALQRAGSELVASERLLDTGGSDGGLLADLAAVRRTQPHVVPWTGHGRVVLRPVGGGFATLVQRAVQSPMTLHGAVLAADGTALEVLGRHEWLVRGRTPVSSSSRLVVPWSALDAVRLVPHERYPDAVVVTFVAGRDATRIAVPAGSAAHRLLAAHGS